MNFKFHISLSDDDYLEYNKFHMLKSFYGARQLRLFRGVVALLFAAFILVYWIAGGFTLSAFLGSIPYFIAAIVFELLLKPFFMFILKRNIKQMKKQGKMAYSALSNMEFYDGYFTEVTDENKTEQKYSAIERVSIVSNKNIYLHLNSVIAYIIPIASFESKEQYDAFVAFIKTKCANVDVYAK
ncbi:MAG: YcxB family protein [Clostridia bacterium]|nr:YcxB family protein [Clostridia bacterium]